jgi:hypothetical protein
MRSRWWCIGLACLLMAGCVAESTPGFTNYASWYDGPYYPWYGPADSAWPGTVAVGVWGPGRAWRPGWHGGWHGAWRGRAHGAWAGGRPGGWRGGRR